MSKHNHANGAEIRAALTSAARERILILDGAMGTEIQDRKFSEADFRGERFKGWNHDLKGNNDLLILSAGCDPGHPSRLLPGGLGYRGDEHFLLHEHSPGRLPYGDARL